MCEKCKRDERRFRKVEQRAWDRYLKAERLALAEYDKAERRAQAELKKALLANHPAELKR